MPRDWTAHYENHLGTAADAAKVVPSNSRVLVGSGCAAPAVLLDALVERAGELESVEIVHLMTKGIAHYVEPKYEGVFRHNAFFIGPNTRPAVREGRADYTPVFLSEIPELFTNGSMPLDVAMVMVSPPNRFGYMSLGIHPDICMTGIESARQVIAQVNPMMPRVHGDTYVHVSDVDMFVEHEHPLAELIEGEPDEISIRIGRHVAELVENEATLQVGIGSIPDAVLRELKNRSHRGLHTEMLSDGVMDLIERGVITCDRKTMHPGKAVASFAMGSQKLYDFLDDNPFFEFRRTEFVNSPRIIAANHKMTAINSALQVDLTGQVCADSLGRRFFSGIGGQVDFVRGAAMSEGGRPIIALPSTAKGGTISRITPMLSEGAGVVTSRGDVHTIVTEWGVAHLHGKTIRERARALIDIAHPDYREELTRTAHDLRWLPMMKETAV
jgi:acyl-CoA hydrolase